MRMVAHQQLGTMSVNPHHCPAWTMWKCRHGAAASLKGDNIPQQIADSQILSQLGQVRSWNFDSNSQTHGAVNLFLFPWDLWAKSPKWAMTRTELAASPQPRAPQPKLKYPSGLECIILSTWSVKQQLWKELVDWQWENPHHCPHMDHVKMQAWSRSTFERGQHSTTDCRFSNPITIGSG